MTYEIEGEGYAIVWGADFETAIVYGPIPADEIQEWIDSYPDDDCEDVIGYSLSEMAVALGELFERVNAAHDGKGNFRFWINDPALVGQEDQKSKLFQITAVPVEATPLSVQLAKDLQEMHASTALDLDLWPTAKAFVKEVTS